jgi:hypothetical protein
MADSDYSNEISVEGSTCYHMAVTVVFAFRRLFLESVRMVFTSPLSWWRLCSYVWSCWPDFIHQVYSLHNTGERNAQSSKFIYLILISVVPYMFRTSWVLLRETVVYAVWYVLHTSVWADWWRGECARDTALCISPLTSMYVKHSIPHTHLSLWGGHKRLETCWRKQKLKLNMNLENCAFLGLCFIIISQCTAHKT